jgi:Phosphate-induced protein 1 conserved region
MLRVVLCSLFLAAFSWTPRALAATAPAQASFVGKRMGHIINRLPGAASAALPSTAPSATNGIQYHGGPIMDDANGVNVYFIWYGDWSKNALAQSVLVNFITHVGGSPYFNINTTYYSFGVGPNGAQVILDPVVNAVHYMGSVDDHYSLGANLTDYQVYLAVANAVTSGALPVDPNGVYFLLTSGNVDDEQTGFGTGVCAWHDSAADLGFPLVDGVSLKFAWVGDAETHHAFECIWNFQTTMSGSLGADGMANSIAHELEESVTDPDNTSWVNYSPYNENADLCNFYFGPIHHSGYASDPQPPDMTFNGIPYLIQWNWLNANGGYCALSWAK